MYTVFAALACAYAAEYVYEEQPHAQAVAADLHLYETVSAPHVITIFRPSDCSRARLARKGDTVTVSYLLKLPTGEFYHHLAYHSFRLGRAEVIRGWDIGVEGMCIGEQRRLVLPSSEAYGDEGFEATEQGEKAQGHAFNVPPNSVVIFDLSLVSITLHE